jgi:hypothetical protein
MSSSTTASTAIAVNSARTPNFLGKSFSLYQLFKIETGFCVVRTTIHPRGRRLLGVDKVFAKFTKKKQKTYDSTEDADTNYNEISLACILDHQRNNEEKHCCCGE